MIKKLTYENLDTGNRMEVRLELLNEDGRWSAKLLQNDPTSPHGAPVFYGFTPDQAERQLKKVFEKDHDLVEESVEG